MRYDGYITQVTNNSVANSGYILPTISSTDLTPGTSALANGQVYLKYD